MVKAFIFANFTADFVSGSHNFFETVNGFVKGWRHIIDETNERGAHQ